MTMTFSTTEGGEGAPPEPDWSQFYADEFDIVEAHDQWMAIINEMREANTLTVANGHQVKRLVEFRVQYERSAKHVAEHGPVLRGKRAKVGQWNPHWSVMCQAQEKILAIEAKLGIDPVSRGKLSKVNRGKKANRPAAAYLKSIS